jgi:hypothetical protein
MKRTDQPEPWWFTHSNGVLPRAVRRYKENGAPAETVRVRNPPKIDDRRARYSPGCNIGFAIIFCVTFRKESLLAHYSVS